MVVVGVKVSHNDLEQNAIGSALLLGVDGVVDVDEPDDPCAECHRSCKGNQLHCIFLSYSLSRGLMIFFLVVTFSLVMYRSVQGLAAGSSSPNATSCCSFIIYTSFNDVRVQVPENSTKPDINLKNIF